MTNLLPIHTHRYFFLPVDSTKSSRTCVAGSTALVPAGRGGGGNKRRRAGSVAGSKGPLIEEHFKTEAEKHQKWSISFVLHTSNLELSPESMGSGWALIEGLRRRW